MFIIYITCYRITFLWSLILSSGFSFSVMSFMNLFFPRETIYMFSFFFLHQWALARRGFLTKNIIISRGIRNFTKIHVRFGKNISMYLKRSLRADVFPSEVAIQKWKMGWESPETHFANFEFTLKKHKKPHTCKSCK